MFPGKRRRVAASVFLMVILAAVASMAQEKESTAMTNKNQSPQADNPITMIDSLIFYPGGTIEFRDTDIDDETLKAILRAVTPSASLCKWKLITVREKAHRLALLESMQAAYKAIDKPQWAAAMEHWKPAPAIMVFCMPKKIPDFTGVSSEIMHPMALIELGSGVMSLILTARVRGIETHWIASALIIQDTIKQRLDIPEDYAIVFFGVAGYPATEVDQQFAPLEDVCLMESWGNPVSP